LQLGDVLPANAVSVLLVPRPENVHVGRLEAGRAAVGFHRRVDPRQENHDVHKLALGERQGCSLVERLRDGGQVVLKKSIHPNVRTAREGLCRFGSCRPLRERTATRTKQAGRNAQEGRHLVHGKRYVHENGGKVNALRSVEGDHLELCRKIQR